jgi:ABC-type uncharacterized transport system substrate-binding protein
LNPIYVTAITGVLSLVSALLPLIGVSNSDAIQKVIQAIDAVLPLAEQEIGVVYQGIKNILDAIGSHPATTDAQLASVQTLNDKVDAAWAKVQPGFDPDYQAPGAA